MANKVCEVRLVGNDVDLHIDNVRLSAGKEAHEYAKKAYHTAQASLRKLELQGYQLVVIDGFDKYNFDLNEFRR